MKTKNLHYVLAVVCLVLSLGCSTGDNAMTQKKAMKTVCLDGVTYYQFRELFGYAGFGYMSVKFNRNGTVNTCEN